MWESQDLAKMHAEDAEDVVSMPRMLEAWWYTTSLASQLIRQQVGGRVSSMWDSQDLAKMHVEDAEDVAKHAENGRGRCQACLGVTKQAYTSQVPTET